MLDNEKPKLGTSSFVSLRSTFGLCLLHISATSFTVTGNKTATYVINRPIRISSSSGTAYAYVGSSTFTTFTTVNLISGSANTAYPISGTSVIIAYASQGPEALYLYDATNLSASALNTLNGTSVAMAIALD